MIVESSRMYNDIQPLGFEKRDFQEKIKQKHINELESKIIYLRRLQFFLEIERQKA